MSTLNLKSVTSAVCALTLTAVLSFFVTHSFNQLYGARGANSGFFAAVTALVR
ncbi:MAG: hypothetical protein ABI821_08110 [Pseudomonadota bacterium]